MSNQAKKKHSIADKSMWGKKRAFVSAVVKDKSAGYGGGGSDGGSGGGGGDEEFGGTFKITIYLPPVLYYPLKVRSDKTGFSVPDLIEELIRQDLERE